MELISFLKPATLTFVNRRHITGDVYSFNFKANGRLDWKAGKHGMIELILPSGRVSRRMFSLSSAPSEPMITVTTKWLGDQASDYKRALWDFKAGDKAKLRGPVGPMCINDYSLHYVFIAGGIGITPFRSMIAEAVLNNYNLNFTLLYVNRDALKIPFKEELDTYVSQLKSSNVMHIVSPRKITEQDIKNSTKDIGNTMYYLSGPPQMVRTYKKILKNMGISRHQIKSDPFMGYK